MTTLTQEEKKDLVSAAFYNKVTLWQGTMTNAINQAERATVDEKTPWANVVAIANLAGGAAALIVPPTAVGWSIPLAILNTASGIVSIPYADGAKFTNHQMKEIYRDIRSKYVTKITLAADAIGATEHARALVQGILEIVAADELMDKKESGLALIKKLFERSQVIPTKQRTAEKWVDDNYTAVYRRALEIFSHSPQSKLASRGKVFVKAGGPYIELFPNESAFNNICLAHDFSRDDVGTIFSEYCNEPIVGALVKSDKQFLYLLTNIWKFKIKRHDSSVTQRVFTPGMAPMSFRQTVSHMEVEALPRSRKLGPGAPKMWRQGVKKDLRAIKMVYNKLRPQSKVNPNLYKYTGTG